MVGSEEASRGRTGGGLGGGFPGGEPFCSIWSLGLPHYLPRNGNIQTNKSLDQNTNKTSCTESHHSGILIPPLEEEDSRDGGGGTDGRQFNLKALPMTICVRMCVASCKMMCVCVCVEIIPRS